MQRREFSCFSINGQAWSRSVNGRPVSYRRYITLEMQSEGPYTGYKTSRLYVHLFQSDGSSFVGKTGPKKTTSIQETLHQKERFLPRVGKMHTLTRSHSDRRSGRERRKSLSLHHFRYKGSERRAAKERRSPSERRNGWVRISRWSSVKMRGLKIAKYLIRNWSAAILPVLFLNRNA